MKFEFNLGDEVDVVATGRVIERTETEFGQRYYLRLGDGRKIGIGSEYVYAPQTTEVADGQV